jgi:hypothetical protein
MKKAAIATSIARACCRYPGLSLTQKNAIAASIAG